MGVDVGKVFQLDWLAKFLYFIFGAMLFLVPLCLLYGAYLSKEQLNFSFGFIVLMLLVTMIAGFGVLLTATAKVTITSNTIIKSDLFKTKNIPLNSILSVKCVYRSNGKGGSYVLLIKTNLSLYNMGFGLPKKKIDEAVAYILEQIRVYYPANLVIIEEEKSKEQSEAVEKFWQK